MKKEKKMKAKLIKLTKDRIQDEYNIDCFLSHDFTIIEIKIKYGMIFFFYEDFYEDDPFENHDL
jgi:hypothetical protein